MKIKLIHTLINIKIIFEIQSSDPIYPQCYNSLALSIRTKSISITREKLNLFKKKGKKDQIKKESKSIYSTRKESNKIMTKK